MIDNYFRMHLEKKGDKLAKLLQLMKVRPVHLTLCGVLLSLISAYFITCHLFISALLTWWCGRVCDGFDGILARKTNTTSLFGAYLDIVCDLTSYSLIILAFQICWPHMSTLWCGILLLYILCSGSAFALGTIEKSAKRVVDNRGVSLSKGIAEGGETGIYYSILLLVPEMKIYVSIIWISMLLITVGMRSVAAYRIEHSSAND